MALGSDGTVVVAGSGGGAGVRVFDLTAEVSNVDDAVCQTVYNDDSAAFLAGLGVCDGEGSVDVCAVCAGGEYPIGPARACGLCPGGEYPIGSARACGVCPPGEYRHATSYACDPCPADTAECQAVFGSRAWALDSSLTCGGLVSGCVATLGLHCSPGYYGVAGDGGTCVPCTGHAVGTVQRGDPVPADAVGTADVLESPSAVAVSGSGAVLAVVFGRAVHVYSWSGVAWEQRGDDIISAAVGSGLSGSVVALSEDGNIVASSAPFASAIAGAFDYSGAVAVFIWDGASWSPMGSAIVGDRARSVLGASMELSALGSVLVVSDNGDSVSRALVYVWDARSNDWIVRGAPLAGPTASVLYDTSVAMSGDGDVVAVRTDGETPSRDVDKIICVYEWVSANSQYEKVGERLLGVLGTSMGGPGSVALSGDGLVLAASVPGEVAGRYGSVQVFGRDGEEWVPMGSIIEGAAAADFAGASLALSENGHVLVVPSRGSDSNKGSVAVYVWSLEDWEQREGVVVGPLAGGEFGRYTALSSDGTVVAVGSSLRSGVRVFDLTAELGNVDDAVCQTAYNDDSAAYVASVGVCNGEGSVDVCVVCVVGEYPIGPAGACGVCAGGEYRHATSYTCEPCPADSAECQAVFGSEAWTLDSSLTCGGLVSGCVSS